MKILNRTPNTRPQENIQDPKKLLHNENLNCFIKTEWDPTKTVWDPKYETMKWEPKYKTMKWDSIQETMKWDPKYETIENNRQDPKPMLDNKRLSVSLKQIWNLKY